MCIFAVQIIILSNIFLRSLSLFFFFPSFFQVELVLDMEEMLPVCLAKRALVTKQVEYPNRNESKVWVATFIRLFKVVNLSPQLYVVIKRGWIYKIISRNGAREPLRIIYRCQGLYTKITQLKLSLKLKQDVELFLHTYLSWNTVSYKIYFLMNSLI